MEQAAPQTHMKRLDQDVRGVLCVPRRGSLRIVKVDVQLDLGSDLSSISEALTA